MGKATVAIIGGGFSGTVAAIRLLTATHDGSPSLPFGSKIVLIEPGRAGEGLAYRQSPDYWRLNVPAERMSAFPERPGDFLDWARARNAPVSGGDFLPRAWYGDYLAERLDLARRRSPRWLDFDQIRERAVGINVADNSARITLANGDSLVADRVVLALGNAPEAARLPNAPQVVDDAWNLDWIDRLPTEAPRVLLVGTGLTMIDQVLALSERRPDARILAISRHGLLPLPHEDAQVHVPVKFDAQALLERGPLSQRLNLFREQVRAASGDWRGSLQQVREVMPALWLAATRRLRRRFLRHLRAYWDVHRHRVPRQTLLRIELLREQRRLEIKAGRIVGTRPNDGGVVATWRPRGSDGHVEELVDIVVNVTGPDGNPRNSNCPLVQSLVEQGLCEPDGFGLGWATDRAGRLLDVHGIASQVLYYAGPALRARHWEAIAVPELRTHVQRSVTAISASLASNTGSYFRRIATPLFRRESSLF